MAVGYLLRLAGSCSPKPLVSPDLCKRVRFRQSDCQKCLEVCPDAAIELNPGPSISDACSECGFCQVACPTGVFTGGRHSDDRLLDQLTSSCQRESSPTTRRTARAYCQRAESPDAAAVRVPCMGLVGHHALIGAALSGVDELHLTKGRCSECRLAPGEALLENAVSSSRVLLEGLGLSDFQIQLEVAERRDEVRFGRRDIFSILGNGPRSSGAGSSKNTKRTGQASESKRLESRSPESGQTSTGHSLRRLLEGVDHRGEDIDYEAGLPWGRLRIDEDLCTACGTCVVVCPTDALGQAFEDPHQVFYFRSSHCTNCSLCQEVCPERAVEFEDRISVADILDESWEVVAEIELSSCILCGETIPVGEGKICPTCDRRRVGALWAGVQK